MHNLFYIAIRTLPFWCFPIGLGFIATGIKVKGKKKHLGLGIFLVILSIVFFLFNGQWLAVPLVHEMLNSSKKPGGF